MIETFRELLYPLGFFAQLFFGIRFFYQWIESEKRKESFIDPAFWILTIIACTLFSIHALIQSQFAVFLAQAGSVYIAYRLLSLMKGATSIRGKTALLYFFWILFFATLIFAALSKWTGTSWFRSPNASVQLGFTVHIFGALSVFLFSSRLVVQWYLVERGNGHELHPAFWYMSVFGALASFFYFVFLKDIVNMLGAFFSMVPFIRNLMLLKKR